MTRLPILSAKELIQILGKLGYQEVRQPYQPRVSRPQTSYHPQLQDYWSPPS